MGYTLKNENFLFTKPAHYTVLLMLASLSTDAFRFDLEDSSGTGASTLVQRQTYSFIRYRTVVLVSSWKLKRTGFTNPRSYNPKCSASLLTS